MGADAARGANSESHITNEHYYVLGEEVPKAVYDRVHELDDEIERLRAALDELTDPPTYSEANFEAMVDKAREALRD